MSAAWKIRSSGFRMTLPDLLPVATPLENFEALGQKLLSGGVEPGRHS